MMNMGKRLREKRLSLGLTQEEAAAHIGVSAQAVSKWERQEGFPDVTLLPALARLYATTTDELLGLTGQAADAEYARLNRQWQEYNAAGRHGDSIALMRQALHRFPGDALLMVQLSTSLEKAGGDNTERQANLAESIRVQEEILRLDRDPDVTQAARFNLCFTLDKAGRRQEALAHARKLPTLWKIRENALAYFTEATERRQIALAALDAIAWTAALHLKTLARQADIPPLLTLLLGGREDDLTRRIRRMAEE